MQSKDSTNQYFFSTSPEHAAGADAPRANDAPFHARPMLTLAFGLLLGLYLGEHFSLLYAAIAALVLLLAALGARLTKRAMWSLFLLAMAAGFLRIALATPGIAPTGQGAVTGTICEAPELRDDGTYRVYLKDASLDGEAIEGKLRFYGAFAEAPAYGQNIRVIASVVLSSEKYKANDRYQGVSAVAFGRESASVLSQDPIDLYGRLLQLREITGGKIAALFPNSPGEAKGMLLGDVTDIDDEMLTAFRDTGIAHLLSVSGLHVSLLAAAFSLLFRRNAWVRFFAVALFLLLYSALTAFSPPVVRSAIMLLVALLAFPLRRRLDTLSSLCTAFVLILLYNPYALWNAGFQLSFVAVYSMILLAPLFASPLARLGSSASGLVGASAAVVIGTFPTTCLFFEQAQFLSLVTNLFVIPISAVFLIPAFIGTILAFVWFPLGNLVCAVARLALDVILAIASYGGKLSLTVSAPPMMAYLLWLVAMFFASRYCLWNAKRRALYAGLLTMLAVVMWVFL
ncbi:MAG TPA: ComEC/Rec2 family competence protein [Feifaniaceae bacterium]|nr:ComEC/Rec2 family competence protein [Feifaniaceae bacterium]